MVESVHIQVLKWRPHSNSQFRKMFDIQTFLSRIWIMLKWQSRLKMTTVAASAVISATHLQISSVSVMKWPSIFKYLRSSNLDSRHTALLKRLHRLAKQRILSWYRGYPRLEGDQQVRWIFRRTLEREKTKRLTWMTTKPMEKAEERCQMPFRLLKIWGRVLSHSSWSKRPGSIKNW